MIGWIVALVISAFFLGFFFGIQLGMKPEPPVPALVPIVDSKDLLMREEEESYYWWNEGVPPRFI